MEHQRRDHMLGRRDSGMFKSEKTAKVAVMALMALFGVGVPLGYLHADYPIACLFLGLELVFFWGYLNPWILREKYSLFFYVDTSKMVYNQFLIAGGIIVAGSMSLIVFG